MIEYLILDYNRPEEAKILVESIKLHSAFDHSVTFLSNGGEQDYAKDLQEKGLIDNLILNKFNSGEGGGATQLFAQCQTEYAFYIEVDQSLIEPLSQEQIDRWINILESGEYHCIDLAGDQNQGRYSMRAQFIGAHFWNSISKTIGGPGPWHNITWMEGVIHKYFIDNDLKIFRPPSPSGHARRVFKDRGLWRVRANPDGSEWRQRADTKQLWVLKKPSEKFVYPNFTDEEWEEVLGTQSWPDGKIPFNEVSISYETPEAYWK